jgi:hypothetical protein
MKRLFTYCLLGLLWSLPALHLQAAEVALVEDHGIYKIPVRINDVLTLDFVIDSGASEVQVPADVALTLLRTGTITQDDFLPGKTYVLADGSNVKSERFILKHLKVGNVLVNQVEAGITGIDGQLLLGQSFLQKIDAWSLDNKRKVLVLNGSSNDSSHGRARIQKTEIDNTSQTESPKQNHANFHAAKGWKSDWGSGIVAVASKTPCPLKSFADEGFLYNLDVSLPSSRIKHKGDAWKIVAGRAVTVQGCWYSIDGPHVKVKMNRRRDDKEWEQQLNFEDGSWTELK